MGDYAKYLFLLKINLGPEKLTTITQILIKNVSNLAGRYIA